MGGRRAYTLLFLVFILCPLVASKRPGDLSEDEIILRAEKDAESEEDPFFSQAEKEGAEIVRKKELAAMARKNRPAVHASHPGVPLVWHEPKQPVAREDETERHSETAPQERRPRKERLLRGHIPPKNTPAESLLVAERDGARMDGKLDQHEDAKQAPEKAKRDSFGRHVSAASKDDGAPAVDTPLPSYTHKGHGKDRPAGTMRDHQPAEDESAPVDHGIGEQVAHKSSSAHEKRDIGEDILRNMMASLNKDTKSEVDEGGYTVGPGEEDQEDTVPPKVLPRRYESRGIDIHLQRYMNEMLNELPQKDSPYSRAGPTLAEVVPSSQTHMSMMSNATGDSSAAGNTTVAAGGIWQTIENLPAWSSMQSGLQTLQKQLMGFSKVLNTEAGAVSNQTTPAATSGDAAPQLDETRVAVPRFDSAGDIADDINKKLISLRAELDTFKKMRKERESTKTSTPGPTTDLAEKQPPSTPKLEGTSEY